MTVQRSAATLQRTIRRLRRVPLLREIDHSELRTLATRVRRRRVQRGAVIMRQGDPADGLYLLVRGALEVIRVDGGEELLVGTLRPGAFVGEMALLAGLPRSATVRARCTSELLVIAPADFHELVGATPTGRAVLRAVACRVATTEHAMLQREKLWALGTLAAGLAHELNNPAAALAASALQLERRLPQLETAALAAGADAAVGSVLAAMRPAGEAPGTAAATEALASYLEAAGVASPHAAAHALSEAGWDAATLRSSAEPLGADGRRRLLEALSARCDAALLTHTVLSAARAISGVVAAVRAGAAAEAAARQPLNLRDSISAALDLVGPRRRGHAVVTLKCERDVFVSAHPGELIQVWSNLLGNALDALAGQGHVHIRIREQGGRAVVEIRDDGPGIAADVRDRIFEPFFSAGRSGGMGIGLHIARTLIVERYRGRIDVRSRPGRTLFRVTLPAEAEAQS